MSFPPSVSDFQTFFAREFPYGTGAETVTPNDIQRAINEVPIGPFNPDLWDAVTPIGTLTEAGIGYLYLAAHYLARNIQAAGGLGGAKSPAQGTYSSGTGPMTAKSVGQVSITLGLPQSILDSPVLNSLLSTDFGVKYVQLLYPRLIGNVQVVSGRSYLSEGLLSVIMPAPLQITTLTLPGGTHSVPYSQTLKAIGGVGAYAWSIVSGTLPTGLSLNAVTGVLAGTPSGAGTFYFQVRTTDVLGNTAEMNYQVVIA